MKILGLIITPSHFPWQKGYNWKGMTNNRAPLNFGGARFGGGWKYKFGIDFGGSTVIVNCGWGMIRIERAKP